jgi:hypothetical protein
MLHASGRTGTGFRPLFRRAGLPRDSLFYWIWIILPEGSSTPLTRTRLPSNFLT